MTGWIPQQARVTLVTQDQRPAGLFVARGRPERGSARHSRAEAPRCESRQAVLSKAAKGSSMRAARTRDR